jgi:hypothetical protein
MSLRKGIIWGIISHGKIANYISRKLLLCKYQRSELSNIYNIELVFSSYYRQSLSCSIQNMHLQEHNTSLLHQISFKQHAQSCVPSTSPVLTCPICIFSKAQRNH